MVIRYADEFWQNLNEILDFISANSESNAQNFLNELKSKIMAITDMPYRFRKNLIANDDNIRDLIFKGYVIPFEVDKETIKILTIYKFNLWH
ncbi:type II toxin-antitoxin system RelE/ParE family toxin [Campylobacter curvus]|uniref:type II toxin-antitoxin system RelE/ParE family toxin n=1 Tax=Campylobacter curvus TaxID=200 RepID=UPI0003765849|nr:type II toxin-antitoxin system RelE/ParE family toxin [Campylobacter curvus]QKF60351.1 toxin-antitoxin system, toxin component, RelE/ParE family [Campylobacter curvus]UEB50486.1 type II toxin-antitoxin system RelE/ParE family toxin [Campylobacter curvus]